MTFEVGNLVLPPKSIENITLPLRFPAAKCLTLQDNEASSYLTVIEMLAIRATVATIESWEGRYPERRPNIVWS